MCARPSWEPDHSSAVSVVPMPCSAGLAWTMSRSALVGAADGVVEGVQQLAARHVSVQRPQRLDDGGAGHLAGRVTAHPVGHREQPGAGVGGVLVALAVQAGVGPHRIADGECLLAIVHGSVLSRQVADEEDGELPPGRGFRLDLGPVRGQFDGGLGGRPPADRADLGQRHAHPAQPGHQPGLLELARVVEPVRRHRIDPGRVEQPELVVQAERLAGQPGGPGEGPAGHQLHVRLLMPGRMPGASQAGAGPGARSSQVADRARWRRCAAWLASSSLRCGLVPRPGCRGLCTSHN